MSTPHRQRVISLLILSFIYFTFISFAPLLSQERTQANLDQYLKALLFLNNGELNKAKPILEEIISSDTTNDGALFYLAKVELEKNNLSRAKELLLKAIKIDPSNEWYKHSLAILYNYTGESEEAIKLFAQLREEHPYKSELFERLIDLYIQNKEYNKAREVLIDIEKTTGESEIIAITRFNMLLMENQVDSAYNYLIKYDAEQPTPRSAAILGDYYSSLHNDTLAQNYYIKSLSMAPNNAPATFGLAESYRLQGKYDLYFQKINLFLGDPMVEPMAKEDYISQLLSNIRFVETFLPQVDTMMATLYMTHPTDSSIAYNYALFLVKCNDTSNALEVLGKNLNNWPKSKEAHKQLLSLLHYMELWDPMLNGSIKALELFRGDTDFMQLKGIAQMWLGQLSQSISTFKEILRFTKDSAMVVNTLTTIGDLSYQAGNKKEAYKYYKKTLRKEPNHLPALNNYAYYLSLDGGNLKEAYKMSKKSVEIEPSNATYLDTYGWILYQMGNYIEAKGIFKQAMLNGGKENAVMLDHYAEVLFALKEYDIAYLYWDQADTLDPTLGIADKVKKLKEKSAANR